MIDHPIRAALTLLLALGLAASTWAATPDRAGTQVAADDFIEAMNELRSDLEDGVPRSLTRREWRDFERIQDEMETILGDVEAMGELSEEARIELYQLQREFHSMMMDGIRNQRICPDQQQLGTRISRRNCRSREEVEGDRREVRDWLASFPYLIDHPHG